MPIDDRTSTQSYPKPNIANTLADDVGRLRTALDDIDADMAARVTTSDTGTVSTTMLANDAVTYAKIQNVSATDKLLGRSTAGAGDVEEITCTAAGRNLLDDADAAAQRTTLGLGTLATQSGTFSGTSSGTNTGDQTITLTGDVTGSGTGSFATAIAAGVIVDADVNASAAIAGTKISPNFGSQNVVTTGSSTAASLIPSGSSVPSNGVYLPSANSVGISTNGLNSLDIASDGQVNIARGALTISASAGEGGQLTLRNPSNTVGTYNLDVITDTSARLFTTQNNVNLDIGQVAGTGGYVRILTGATERLRVDSAGAVGIGVTNPSTKLHVAGTIRSSSGTDRVDLNQDGSNAAINNSKGNLLFYTPAATGYVWHVDGGQKMRLGAAGDLVLTHTPGVQSIDVTGGQTSIANNGTVDFASSSGMLVVNNHSSGAVTIYLCGGGSTSAVASVGTQVGTFTYVAGIAGYRWTNNSGSTATVGFFFLRTRTTA